MLYACMWVLQKTLIITEKHTMASDVGKLKPQKYYPCYSLRNPQKPRFYKEDCLLLTSFKSGIY